MGQDLGAEGMGELGVVVVEVESEYFLMVALKGKKTTFTCFSYAEEASQGHTHTQKEAGSTVTP